MEGQSTNDFENTIESICNILEGTVSRDVVRCVVENFNGDMNLSLDGLMNLLDEGNKTNMYNNKIVVESNSELYTVDANEEKEIKYGRSEQIEEPSSTHKHRIISNDTHLVTPLSYAATFRKTGTIPKRKITSKAPKLHKSIVDESNMSMWCDDFRKIITYHNQGYRTLVLMRGVPGSGKTFMAIRIIEHTIGSDATDFKSHICSADDFFIFNNEYRFNRNDLSYAHDKNKIKAQNAMDQGVSPIIIDNTNIEVWEMMPYVKYGVERGYYIIVFEPKTHWAKNATLLFKKNKHGLSFDKIQRMLAKFENNITGDSLLKSAGLRYPIDKTPPVLRSMPAPIVATQTLNTKDMDTCYMPPQSQIVNQLCSELSTDLNQCNILSNSTIPKDSEEVQESPLSITEKENPISSPQNLLQISESNCVDTVTKDLFSGVQKQLDEINKIEQEWDNGEDWKETSENCFTETHMSTSAKQEIDMPKPQRTSNVQLHVTQKHEKLEHCQDWASMLMPQCDNSFVNTDKVEISSVATLSNSTCIEKGDIDNKSNMFKVITVSPRDINEFYISQSKNNIPHQVMLHKSTMTNENVITHKRCKNEENHLKQLKKLFKGVPENFLRDILDKCVGDVNWAVNILLDSVDPKQLEPVDGEVSENEDSKDDNTCSCLSAYNILPDTSSHIESESEQVPPTIVLSSPKQKKQQKDVSAQSLQIKQHIEQNVVFADNHYSQYLSKFVKKRRGEQTDKSSNERENDKSVDTSQPSEILDSACSALEDPSDDEDSFVSVDDVKTVNVNVGNDFIKELDMLFGRNDMSYPTQVQPKINIPVSLLNEINALWMESLMHQLDEHDKHSKLMLQQDEELARTIAAKEVEFGSEEQEVPDFKEIMDMDLALSLYQKDVAEWRNKEPKDLAAILSREKLCNLFPDVEKDVLYELLMAHDNNFQATVEVLLMSTGQSEILSQKNGLNNFIVKREMQRKNAKIEEEKKALSEVEWPLLPRGETVEMSVVEEYRNRAERHLITRNMIHLKANEYMRRGMYAVAGHYSQLAAFHSLQYEQASGLAAISLIQVHANRNSDNGTIDLHYMRVGESLETNDLFMDMHIKQLRDSGRGESRELFVITGRGRHSNGSPKIKPAIKKRMAQRGLAVKEINPGLLAVTVSARSLMTYELP